MHGRIYEDITQLIGHTPIVKLGRLTGPSSFAAIAEDLAKQAPAATQAA